MALSRRASRWALAAVVALGLAARLAVIAPRLGRPPDDPDNYLPLARTLAEGRGLLINGRPSAYRPPLYPLALAPIVGALDAGRVMLGVGALHLLLGASTIGLTFAAACRLGLGDVRALAAASIVALDPVLVVQARSVMTETLAATLAAAALAGLAAGSRRGALVGGLAFGLGGLCRPSTLAAAGLATAASLGFGPGTWRERLGRSALIAGATAAVLAPWAARNFWIFGEPVWTTTHGGYTLALANNPVYYAEVLDGPPGAVWSGENQFLWFDGVNRRMAGLPEPEVDRRLTREGLAMLRERPGAFARASLARLGRFWGLAPSGAVYPAWLRRATAAWTAPLWLALGWGLLRRDLWRWPDVSATAFVLALTTVHALFWTDLRMRAPIVPSIALIAAGAGPREGPPGVAGRGRGRPEKK